MRIRQALARFMYGRYGSDELYNALFLLEIILLFVSSILSILGRTTPLLSVVSSLLYLLSLAILIWAMFRFFSRIQILTPVTLTITGLVMMLLKHAKT